LPCTPDERTPCFVLFLTWTFANNHQLGVGISFAKHNILSGCREFAGCTTRANSAKILEISHDLILPEGRI
jgi:hypothetical protein